MSAPRLITTRLPRNPQAAVLVLHGGGARRGSMMVSPAQLSVLRMVPVARRAARAGHHDLAVFRLLNSHRGWDAHHTPVDDVSWALARLAQQLPGLPVGLIGHSLGGRAALLSAYRPEVRSTVALNTYLLPGDRPRLDRGRTLLVQGDEDRISSPTRTTELARRTPASARLGHVSVTGARHAMLRRGRVFEHLAAEFTVGALLGADRVRDDTVASVLSGERWVSL